MPRPIRPRAGSAPDSSADLLALLDASPTPFHACAEVARRLEAAGFERVEEVQDWGRAQGRRFVVRSGSLVAWADEGRPSHAGFRVIGAHTDSPNLRIKPQPDRGCAGYLQLGVEVYGGVLLNSWLDRDLGLAGRVMVRSERGAEPRLVHIDRPLLRVAQLAIHLDREVNDKGLVLDRQLHLTPILGLGPPEPGALAALLARELDCADEDVLAFDLMLCDTQHAARLGREQELIASGRLDNLCSCWCGLTAMLAALERGGARHTPVLCLFDHEEVGSTSARGAAGPLLESVIERVVQAAGGSRADYHRAVADSFCASVDMAHATHPNYPERHEPQHWIEMNKGPVIKINTTQRYASDGEGEALFQLACQRADVPWQKYVHRSNLPCGTTIGPITAARLGMRTFDVGSAQLSMHSIREVCGAYDPGYMARALEAFLLDGSATS